MSKMKLNTCRQMMNMKINNLIPAGVWYALLCVNLGVFGVGMYLQDKPLMLISLGSFAACGISLFTRDDFK